MNEWFHAGISTVKAMQDDVMDSDGEGELSGRWMLREAEARGTRRRSQVGKRGKWRLGVCEEQRGGQKRGWWVGSAQRRSKGAELAGPW